MKNYSLHTILVFILSLISLYSYSVPATPYPITKIQPDGTELTIRLRGDEFFSYETTMDGYLIRKNDTGFYSYATVENGSKIISTNVRVNPIEKRTSEEKEFIKQLLPDPDFRSIQEKNKAARVASSEQSADMQKIYPTTGSPKSLVILVNFSDISFITSNPKAAFNNLLNQEGYSANGGTGSARDYFRDASNGASSPEFVVVGPYNLPNPRSYYGGNDDNEDDLRPRQMVIDACNAANADVDFSIYDTDNDGIVDNVFIYYAGHNEAEGGPKESIWPHRWALSTPLQLDGKYVSGYACTSELRGSSGNYMCGIGTFVHEFGHVYGLPDFYATSATATHHTLSFWDVMDSGPYLNLGRTPPTYSAYERFYLGWLTPTILNSPADVTLANLISSNSAYLLSQSGTHNLNGGNPNPVEFFLLENRQQIGWDAYLPGKGMLITRVYYNSTTWRNNTPNNNPAAMGVDIMEADGTASRSNLSGDPFPGTSNIKHYKPTLRSGTNIGQPLSGIKEKDGIISFYFMGGITPPKLYSSVNDLAEFETTFGTPSATQGFGISGVNLRSDVTVSFGLGTHYELKLENDLTDTWKKSLTLAINESILDSVTVLIRYNPIEASYNELHLDYLMMISEDVDLLQATLIGSSARPVYVVSPVASVPNDVSLNGFLASWSPVYDASGYYLTAYNVTEGSSTFKEGFNNGLIAPIGWTINAASVSQSTNFVGDSIPSIILKNTGEYIETESFLYPATKLSFFVRSLGDNSGTLSVDGWNGTNWLLIDGIAVNSNLNTTKSYELSTEQGFLRFRLRYTKGVDNPFDNVFVSIDDFEISLSQKLEYNVKEKWITGTSAYISTVIPGRDYFFKVRASDRTLNTNKTIKYENITDFSNTVQVNLNSEGIIQYAHKSGAVSVYRDVSGEVLLNLNDFTDDENLLYIYSTDGALLETIKVTQSTISLAHLPKNKIYFARIGANSLKILL